MKLIIIKSLQPLVVHELVYIYGYVVPGKAKRFSCRIPYYEEIIVEGKKEWSDNVFNYTERLSFGIANNYITESSSVGEVEEFLKLQS